MPIIVSGVNHRTAPLPLLERLHISPEALPKALDDLVSREFVMEAAILSTCHRTEIYAATTAYHGGVQNLLDFLSEFCHVPVEEVSGLSYTFHDEGAIGHLFRVASGVDSMVVGESEILGQTRRAFSAAAEVGAAKSVLARAFRHALKVGKRARSESGISRNPASIPTAAICLAGRTSGDPTFAGKQAVVVGAGQMATRAAEALAATSIDRITVVSRTREKAAALAAKIDSHHAPLEALQELLSQADILVSSTSAPGIVIDADLVQDAMAWRASRPLLLVDIAMPRDIDPSCEEIPGVTVHDIYALREVAGDGMATRRAEIGKVGEVIGQEVGLFFEKEQESKVGPAVGALVSKAEAIRLAEVEHMRPKLAELEPEQLEAVEQLTRRIVNKLLHEPVANAKELSHSKQGYRYLRAFKDLFGLEKTIRDRSSNDSQTRA